MYDAKGNVIERRMPTFDGASLFQPAGTDLQLGLNGSLTYLSWVPNIPISSSAITQVLYRPLGDTGAYSAINYIETLAGGRVGVNVNNLYGTTYEYRITTRFNTEPMPIAESNGTFRFDRTSSTNASFPTVTVDAASQVGTIGNQTGGYIVWTAPSDSTVTARTARPRGLFAGASAPRSAIPRTNFFNMTISLIAPEKGERLTTTGNTGTATFGMRKSRFRHANKKKESPPCAAAAHVNSNG